MNTDMDDTYPPTDTVRGFGSNRGPEGRVIEAQRAMTRALAITVPCAEPKCHAGEGEYCRNLTTGDPLDNTSHQPAHLARLRDSGAV